MFWKYWVVKYLENCVSRVYQGICHCWSRWEASPFNIFAVGITRNQSPGAYRSWDTIEADQSHRDLQSQKLPTTNFRCCANPHTLTSKWWLIDKRSTGVIVERNANKTVWNYSKQTKYLLKGDKPSGSAAVISHTWVRVFWLYNKRRPLYLFYWDQRGIHASRTAFKTKQQEHYWSAQSSPEGRSLNLILVTLLNLLWRLLVQSTSLGMAFTCLVSCVYSACTLFCLLNANACVCGFK